MAKKKAQFILSIGDEGAILTYVQGGAVLQRLYAPTANYGDTQPFLDAFQSDPKAPISMLVDVMDQSYLQQTLPPVSPLSVNNIIKRKMERDFAAEDLKGALKIGREKEGRRDWKYLFVTLSRSPQLDAWIDLVLDVPNRFEGIYLLPVEAENFMHTLQRSVYGKPKKDEQVGSGAMWQLLVAHTKVGGFRQVVLRNGKLIFARLAQPIGENQPEVVAGNIEQEISVTTEYLKRLSYSPDQGLDVIVISSDAVKKVIDATTIQARSTRIYSPYEVAQLIELPQAAEAGDQFADVLLAAAFSSAPKHLLKLESERQKELNRLYEGMMAARVGGGLLTVGSIAAILYYGASIPGAQSDISDLQQKTNVAQQELAVIKEQESKLPDSLEKMTDLVSLHQQLNDLGLEPDATLYQLQALGAWKEKVLLREIVWQSNKSVLSADNSSQGNGADKSESLKIELTLDMYGTEVGSREFNDKIDALTEELKRILPGYTVKLTGERPGNFNKTTDFSLDDASRDPIYEKPYYGVVYELTATADTISAQQQPANGGAGA